MVKPEKFDHLHLVYHFTVPLYHFLISCINLKLLLLHLKEMLFPFFKLLLLESTLFQIRNKLKKLFNDKMASCNLKIVFTSLVRVKSFFTFKDKLPKMLHSGFVYTLTKK